MNPTTIIDKHRLSGRVTFYRNCTWKLPVCGCGQEMHPNAHAAHIAEELEKARTITTLEELHDGLPEGTVIRDADGWTFVLMDDSLLTDDPEPVWKSPGWASLNVTLPARVLWHPEADA